MDSFAATFYTWLRAYNIEPDKVQLVVRAVDEQTRMLVTAAARSDLDKHQWVGPPLGELEKIRKLKIHGVSISFSSLDVK